jgi:hypothetical protein
MPQLKEDLARLVAIPSVSVEGSPEETRPALADAYAEVVRRFDEAGAEIRDPLELPRHGARRDRRDPGAGRRTDSAYRVGDSPANVITPLMAYFPLIVIFTQRYRKDAGIGTVVSLMLPYMVILAVLWTLFFVAWYLVGIPLGPGAPVEL